MRAHVLHSLLSGFVQRRGHDVFINSLPRKQEFVILLKMTPIQKRLYLAFMETIGAMNPGEKLNPLRTFAICNKIWNHPDVLYKYNLNKDADLDLDIPELQQQVVKRKSKNKRGSYLIFFKLQNDVLFKI
jgi:RAD54-like protein 2